MKLDPDPWIAVGQLKQLLRWVWNTHETFGDCGLGEYSASTDFQRQEQTWRCFGCNGSGKSKWPEWKLEFNHNTDCMYIKLKELAERNVKCN